MDDVRVSTIELFFDLVFVFTITQLTSVLVAEPNATGVARVALIFGNLWWMYGGYAWLTNAVPPTETGLRLLMLVGMGAYLVVALSIPRAFGEAGIAFGIGYLVVNVVHAGMFLRSTQESAVRAVRRLGPMNVITAALLLAAGWTHGDVRWGIWAGSFVLHWITPAITAVGGFRIKAAHFVERHGLIVLIALGESVVAVGLGVQHRRITAGLVFNAVLGLGLAAALWWLYFDGEDERAERALDDAPDARNPWLSLYAFGYAFLPVLTGVVVLAAGMRLSIVRYGHHATTAGAWFLAGGVAAYAAGLALFRVILRTGPPGLRIALCAAAVATAPLGLWVSAEAQIAALTALAAAAIALE